MSNDPIAVVFNLDPRLRDRKHIPSHTPSSRKNIMSRIQEIKFFGSLRTKFEKADSDMSFFGSLKPHKKQQTESGGKRDAAAARRASVVEPIANASIPLPPSPPAKSDNRLPKHSNVFTGVPTPTDTTANSRAHSSANSEDAGSGPRTPGTKSQGKDKRSVSGPMRLNALLEEYHYTERAEGIDELPEMSSAQAPHPFSHPSKMAGEVGALGGLPSAPEAVNEDSFLGKDGPKVGGRGGYQSQKRTKYASLRNLQQQRHLLGQGPPNMPQNGRRHQTPAHGLIEKDPGQVQRFIPSVSQRLHPWKPQKEAEAAQGRLRTSTSTSPLTRHMRAATDGAPDPKRQSSLPFPQSASPRPEAHNSYNEWIQRPQNVRQGSELFLGSASRQQQLLQNSYPRMCTGNIRLPEFEGAPLEVGTRGERRATTPSGHPKAHSWGSKVILLSEPGFPADISIGRKELARLAEGFRSPQLPTPPSSSCSPGAGGSDDGDEGKDDEGEDPKTVERYEGEREELRGRIEATAGLIALLYQICGVGLSRDDSQFLMKIWYIFLMTWAMWALAKLSGCAIEVLQVIVLEPGRILSYALKRWLGG